MIKLTTPTTIDVVAGLTVLALAGCGSSTQPPASSSRASTSAQTTSSPSAPAASAELVRAEQPRPAQFPTATGKTLQQVANLATAQAQLGAATGTFTPGTRRFAFGVTATSGEFVYGPTALYIATGPNAPAQGPFLAAADPMIVNAPYRSRQDIGPAEIQAIYAAQVPIPRPGTYAVLALTRFHGRVIGSTGKIAAASSSPIPGVGQRPPAIATETPASVGGNVGLLTTRVPPDDMHKVSFKDVLGKRPIALLFSTPQLCQSRVCGPVTDVAAQLEHEFGDRVAFIHEEVYVNNDPRQGLRPQLKAFHLQTEPWLFTVNRRGVIAACLEGAFGTAEFRQAVQAALQ